jgi:predicted nuclease of predicted toxin-antitoxin system
MKLLIDMNLSPRWVAVFEKHGWESIHWSEVGDPTATDAEIMSWADTHAYVVFTHDLDFSAILAATQAQGPSVIQVRIQDVLPESVEDLIVNTLRQFETLLQSGALITIDPSRSRARVLPLLR